ncbi:uncharacterized protein HKBW3S42_01010 [Candidatus Hakubella thermalkaliphila]|uniref:UPF0434 protein HKBW3S42_01010 n=1 Tax=Candidatus Hakubella thermalkaliphila TaxID=2754717 RepID=A0A6V8PLT4_9ACTN|nr:uncharacterized protein HKBW3S42_01010 [Candidatus Hakubella thermalkaliphila]
MIDRELLDILACPKCKGDLKLREKDLVCLNCRKYYPIKDGIPILLIDEAKDLEAGLEGN